MATQTPPAAARRNYAVSALIGRRAVREARKARPRGTAAVAAVVMAHQLTTVRTSEAAVAEILVEQEIDSLAEGLLNELAFTTDAASIDGMLADVEADWQFDQLVDSLVQDSARAAESVSVAVRPDIYHVRYVSPPCCSRCAILAGRVYRWSDGFERHPGCDCSMIPTTIAAPYAQDPDELVRNGQVRGLSKADMEALAAGADLSQIVNVRLRKAGLLEGGHALARGGRPTPAGIYRMASSRTEAVALLKRYRYVR